jgi:hypothetical protein
MMRARSVPTAVRAAAIALALGATAMTAVPSQAQGFGFSLGFGEARPGVRLPHRLCLLTSSALRREIRRQGYTDIYLNVPINQRIQVRASRGRWVYLLTVNSCTGRILDRERLRPR